MCYFTQVYYTFFFFRWSPSTSVAAILKIAEAAYYGSYVTIRRHRTVTLMMNMMHRRPQLEWIIWVGLKFLVFNRTMCYWVPGYNLNKNDINYSKQVNTIIRLKDIIVFYAAFADSVICAIYFLMWALTL